MWLSLFMYCSVFINNLYYNIFQRKFSEINMKLSLHILRVLSPQYWSILLKLTSLILSVLKYMMSDWNSFSWIQIACIFSIVFGSLFYFKFMSFRIVRHFKGEKFEKDYEFTARDLDGVDQTKSLRKQMGEYLTMCGKKRSSFWFVEEKPKSKQE